MPHRKTSKVAPLSREHTFVKHQRDNSAHGSKRNREPLPSIAPSKSSRSGSNKSDGNEITSNPSTFREFKVSVAHQNNTQEPDKEYEPEVIYFKRTQAYQVLKPAILALKYLMCYVRDKNVRKKGWRLYIQYVRMCFSFLLIVLASVVAVRLILLIEFDKGIRLTARTMYLFAITMFVVQSVVLACFIIYWFYTGKIRRFLVTIHTVSEGEGSIKYRRSVTVVLNRVWTVLLLVIMLVIVGFFVYIQITVPNEHILADVHVFYTPALDWLAVMLVAWGWGIWLSCMVFYSRLCECAAVEFKYYNYTLKRDHRHKRLRNAALLEHHFRRHIDFSEIVEHLSDMIQYMLLVLLCLNIPILILCLYTVLSKSLKWYELVVSWLFAGINIVQMLTLTMLPAVVHEQAHRAQDILHAATDLWIPADIELVSLIVTYVIILSEFDNSGGANAVDCTACLASDCYNTSATNNTVL